MMSLGTKVKQYREAKRLSQDDLALRLDVTQSTISNIESDKSIPNSMLLSRIAKELDVDMNQLFDDKVTNVSNIEKNDGVVNTGSGTINMQSPELIESILKNQEQIAHLIDSQNKLIEKLFKK
ncbi:helix-turn-helix domain-containing protein [Chryseobacterium sp. CCH4-E10]|uniref:helix-turn-helix domain-containing protein n=1 Tax=Chryseobacterium sp. CCH4-E10 TaxID=1768758 RepID=UPI0009EB5C69|nr:helix-turn-helix transcriptional regulator [Chryseobacterium sp. CCH4-E10]